MKLDLISFAFKKPGGKPHRGGNTARGAQGARDARGARVALAGLAFAGLLLGSCASRKSQGGEIVILSQSEAAAVCYIEPTEELKSRLSPEEYAVLVQAATESPFQNSYWDNHRAGIYVDRIDGTPLFASSAKFDSGTGWPSFWKPIDEKALVLVEDRSYGMIRIEVRSKSSGGHLGHLFDDGPKPTGLRYCINSASLEFIPLEEMEARGYGKLIRLLKA